MHQAHEINLSCKILSQYEAHKEIFELLQKWSGESPHAPDGIAKFEAAFNRAPIFPLY